MILGRRLLSSLRACTAVEAVLGSEFCRHTMAEASGCVQQQIGSPKPKILVVAGSTSVGKTELSLRLATLLNGEVISADSVQVFRGLDIGSAKVTREEMASVRHHLLDVAEIDAEEVFSVADFCDLAQRAIKDIISRGRVPLVVGGTGMHILTLLEGGASHSPPSTAETKAMMSRLVEEEDGGCWEKSIARLKALDPVYAESLYPNDWYRLKRALEICLLSGSTVTSFKKEPDIEDTPYDAKCLFLSMPRVQLFERIDTRCEKILENGLLQEVVALVKKGRLKLESQAGRCVGYRQVLEYLQAVWGFPPPPETSEGAPPETSEGTPPETSDGTPPETSKGGPYSLKVPRKDLEKSFYEFLFQYKSKTRQLAQMQLRRFKTAPGFQWVNVAPGQRRLCVDRLSEAVAAWFNEGTPLPGEWDGTNLQTLTPAEKQALKEYSFTHSKPQAFADKEKVADLLASLEESLQS